MLLSVYHPLLLAFDLLLLGSLFVIVRVDGRQVGQFRLENLPPSTVPVKTGDSYWEIPQNVVESPNVEVFQGSLEQANVNPSMELVNMIKVTRAYEQMQKAIQSMDDMTQRMIQSAKIQ